MTPLSIRLKAWREGKMLKQDEAASLLGVPAGTYQKYEMGIRAPGAASIEAFVVSGGINANWLLTGQGPMLVGDLQAAGWSGALDRERMRISLKAIEKGLKATDRVMAPAAKAELLLAVYDLLEDSSVTEEKVMNIVKLAA
jgi:transcriptional regulator with XRE-family HTH domain